MGVTFGPGHGRPCSSSFSAASEARYQADIVTRWKEPAAAGANGRGGPLGPRTPLASERASPASRGRGLRSGGQSRLRAGRKRLFGTQRAGPRAEVFRPSFT